MNNDELRERAGKQFFDSCTQDHYLSWERLTHEEQEYWRNMAWPLVQLGRAAGLQEAAEECRTLSGRIGGREHYGERSEAAQETADFLQEIIATRAKEVEGDK
jgi:hypothetical protein